jgi:hypothetical protein
VGTAARVADTAARVADTAESNSSQRNTHPRPARTRGARPPAKQQSKPIYFDHSKDRRLSDFRKNYLQNNLNYMTFCQLLKILFKLYYVNL